jgi:hypothetical protein
MSITPNVLLTTLVTTFSRDIKPLGQTNLNIVIGTGTIYGDSVGGRTVNLTFRRTDN